MRDPKTILPKVAGQYPIGDGGRDHGLYIVVLASFPVLILYFRSLIPLRTIQGNFWVKKSWDIFIFKVFLTCSVWLFCIANVTTGLIFFTLENA